MTDQIHPRPVRAAADFEVAVVGGGPAGLLAACLLGDVGVSTVLLAPDAPPDTRTTALMQGSLDVLGRIGLWPALAPRTGRLAALRIVDASRRLIRAPEVTFHAGEIGLAAFGHNIANRDLVSALRERAAAFPSLSMRLETVVAVEPAPDRVRLELSSGERLTARLVVGADGRRSLCRAAAGIRARSWEYPQSALALNIRHTRPHRDVSTELHTETGPFTLVPLPGDRSSVVAVLKPHQAEALTEADDVRLAAELEARSHGILGAVEPDGPRSAHRLGGLEAQRFAANRVALVGEAGHVLPPIGAQGLNLGVRDAATLAEVVMRARRRGRDVGAPEVLDGFHRIRRADIRPRALAVDALNRSLLTDFLPAQAARGLGLFMLGRIAPLRRVVMRGGLAPQV